MSVFSKQKTSRGFSLVELLVVISIISVLLTTVYANFGKARATARDNIRKADLKSLQLAINLYKAQNGRYPNACNGTADYSGGTSGVYVCTVPGADYIIGLVPGYLPKLPIDPKASSPSTGYLYRVNAAGTDFKLLAEGTVEQKFITSYSDEYARCNSRASSGIVCSGATPPSATYAIYSPGAVFW